MLTKVGITKSDKDFSINTKFENKKNEIIETSLLEKETYDIICIPTIVYNSSLDLNNRQQIICDELIEAIYKSIIIEHNKITNNNNLLISLMGVGDILMNLNIIETLHENELCFKIMGYKNIAYLLVTMSEINNIDEFIKRINEKNIPLKIKYITDLKNSKAIEKLFEYRDQINNNKEIVNMFNIYDIENIIEIDNYNINKSLSPEKDKMLIKSVK